MRESVLSLIGAVALAACSGTAETPAPAPAPTEPAPAEAPAKVEAKHAALFGVLPDSMYASEPATEAQVALGRMLYYETRISKNHDLSCNSCHKLDAYGVDNEPTSPGHKGVRGARNSPTTYNAALHLAQFWDGRAADVEEQAKGPVLNPVE
ncbi:MAG: cytochrome-c peroxidase, partial [Myxococcota bacterium]